MPRHTVRGIEQNLYACAGAVEASVKTIELELNATGHINVMNNKTVPAKWYIEKSKISINNVNPWWGGVKFGETIPKNSELVSETSLWLPAGSSYLSGISADAHTSGACGAA